MSKPEPKMSSPPVAVKFEVYDKAGALVEDPCEVCSNTEADRIRLWREDGTCLVKMYRCTKCGSYVAWEQ